MLVKMVALIMSTFVALALNIDWASAAEPTAAGLWQNLNEAGQPDGWFLIMERNGTYEGVIARMFIKPGDDPNALCTDAPTTAKTSRGWAPLIRGMKRQGLNYEGGILDPRDGTIYRALMARRSRWSDPYGARLSWLRAVRTGPTWTRLPGTAMKNSIQHCVPSTFHHHRLTATSGGSHDAERQSQIVENCGV